MPDRRDTSVHLTTAMLVLAWLLVVVVRALAPSDLMDNDQGLVAAYTTDIVANGDWIVQTDETGSVASKPPLYQWIAAAISLPFGRVSLVTLCLPGALAVLAMMLLTARLGRVWFDPRVGALAGLAVLCCSAGLKVAWYARTDGLYALLVFSTAVALLRAARVRTWAAWLIAWAPLTLATMTKTPFAVPLAFFGLAALLWGPRPAPPRGRAGGGRIALANLAGAALLVIVVGGWYMLAQRVLGDAVRAKLVEGELVRHAVGTLDDEFLGKGFLRQPWYFLSRLAPWSVLAIIAGVRAIRQPDDDADARLRTRFLLCFIAGGFLFVCLASRPRPEHLYPFIPAVALLAAREVARLMAEASPRAWRGLLATIALVAIGAIAWDHSVQRADSWRVRQTTAMRALADQAHLLGLQGDEVVHIDSPYALQFFLGTMRLNQTTEEAAALLREGFPGAVGTTDPASLAAAAGRRLVVVARWPEEGDLAPAGGVALVRLADR